MAANLWWYIYLHYNNNSFSIVFTHKYLDWSGFYPYYIIVGAKFIWIFMQFIWDSLKRVHEPCVWVLLTGTISLFFFIPTLNASIILVPKIQRTNIILHQKALSGIMMSFRVIRLVISTNKQNTEGTCLFSVIKKYKT